MSKLFYKNWHVHNIVGHPIMGVLIVLNIPLRLMFLASIAQWVHDVTLPKGAIND